MKLVDMLELESSDTYIHVGSSPTIRIIVIMVVHPYSTYNKITIGIVHVCIINKQSLNIK